MGATHEIVMAVGCNGGVVSPFQGCMDLGAFHPGRRSRTRLALGYPLSGFQPFLVWSNELEGHQRPAASLIYCRAAGGRVMS